MYGVVGSVILYDTKLWMRDELYMALKIEKYVLSRALSIRIFEVQQGKISQHIFAVS
jgi:hypothetical protein